ncbi:hypothetical protein LguiA_027740 [Lonicera macranthoides]
MGSRTALKMYKGNVHLIVETLNGCSVIVSKSLITQMLKRFSKEWIPAFGFFKWAKLQTGFKHSPDSYNLMVDNLGKSRKFALMWEIVEEMHKLGRATQVRHERDSYANEHEVRVSNARDDWESDEDESYE